MAIDRRNGLRISRDVLKDQAYLARKGEFLGEKQRHLGAKQSELIKQIGQAVERLFEDAREQGKAQPIKRR